MNSSLAGQKFALDWPLTNPKHVLSVSPVGSVREENRTGPYKVTVRPHRGDVVVDWTDRPKEDK